jgi:hypothetical protein
MEPSALSRAVESSLALLSRDLTASTLCAVSLWQHAVSGERINDLMLILGQLYNVKGCEEILTTQAKK